MPQLIDTHVHLDDPRLWGELEQVLALAEAMKVSKMINVGHDLKSSAASVALATNRTNIWATIGIHPHGASTLNSNSLQQLTEMAKGTKVVAVGEIGLDYHYDHSPRDVQRRAFAAQLDLASALDLPVIIHQREAAQDALALLEQLGPLSRGGIMHCFFDSVKIMHRCLDLNLHIGIGGAVTFQKASQVKEVAKAVPLTRLVLETDCPYLTPHPHRGKVNQPGYLPLIATEIARLRAIDQEELIDACTKNAEKLFSI